MSIEALLEAAKYVERRVDEANDECPRLYDQSRQRSVAQDEQSAREAAQHQQSHPVIGGVKTANYHPTMVVRQPSVTEPRIETPSFNFYRPLRDPALADKRTSPTSRTKKELYKPVVTMAIRTTEPPPTTAVAQSANRHSGQTTTYGGSHQRSAAEPVQSHSQTPPTDSNVMRHPGYDVRWSYSAPEARAPTPPSIGQDGDTQKDARLEELTTSEDAEDGKKTGVREVHNKLEKNRRAHLKECFDELKDQIPTLQDRKMKISNSNILSGACRYVGALKRKAKELEHELDWLVREKIRKQKLLHQLKMERGKSLHVGMPWHQEGSVLNKDLLQQQTAREKRRKHKHRQRERERDEEDRYSTSTASEAEEEERKVEMMSLAVATTVTMTTTLASSQESCTSTLSTSAEMITSHGHPLKNHLLREHRAQEAMKTTAPSIQIPGASSADANKASIVTVVPSMPISPNSRPTVSQLLGKQTTPVRQPVRRQIPNQTMPAVVHPVGIPIQRYQVRAPGYTQLGIGQIAVRPSQPVVTIGVTPTLPAKSDIKLSHSQAPIVSQPLKPPTRQLVRNTNNLGHAVSIVSTSLAPSFIQAIPGFPATSLTQPLFSPITLTTAPVKQVVLANQNLAGYAAVPSVMQSLIGPFTSNTPTLVSPILPAQTNKLMSVYPNPLQGPQTAPTVLTDGALTAGRTIAASGTTANNSLINSHQLTTVPVLNPWTLPRAVPKSANPTKSVSANVLAEKRPKPMITTSELEKKFLASGGIVKTVVAGSDGTKSTLMYPIVR